MKKAPKTSVTFDFVNIRSSRRYFACRGPGTSLILKELPIGEMDQSELPVYIDHAVIQAMFSIAFRWQNVISFVKFETNVPR